MHGKYSNAIGDVVAIYCFRNIMKDNRFAYIHWWFQASYLFTVFIVCTMFWIYDAILHDSYKNKYFLGWYNQLIPAFIILLISSIFSLKIDNVLMRPDKKYRKSIQVALGFITGFLFLIAIYYAPIVLRYEFNFTAWPK